jgi:cholesterol transport system auxiliary component
MTLKASIVLISLSILPWMGGCAGLLESREPAAVIYLLRPTVTPMAMSVDARTLQVQRVSHYPGYETDRILLTRPERRLDVYAGSRWAEALPKVVEAMVLDALRTGGGFAAVHDSLAPYASDHVLRLTIRRFEAEYADLSAAPRVRVAFEASLGRRLERSASQNFSIETTAAARSNRMSDIVAAFEEASAEALQRLLEETQAARPAASP